jgi:hypothetical protein
VCTRLRRIENPGSLWLPWYVEREIPTSPIGDLHRDFPRARALRVQDALEDEDVRVALAVKTAHGAHGRWSHLDGIAYHRKRLNLGRPIGPFPAWATSEGLLLRDGCHRTCALYEAQPKSFELVLDVSPAPVGAVDALPGLRRAGR